MTPFKTRRLTALWISLLCGSILDLLAANTRFGLYAFNTCLTTWILYRQKRNFFEDSLSTIPLMTLFFSITSTLLQVVLLYTLDRGIAISWMWAVTDLLVLPLADAAYALLFFTLPLALLGQRSVHNDA